MYNAIASIVAVRNLRVLMKSPFLMASLALTLFAGAVSARQGSSDQRISAGAPPEEQVRYIHACVKDPSCSSALMQIWQANGKDVSLERYLPPENKVPLLLRGTDMGRKMRDLEAINRCVPEERCRAFLVEATHTIRMVAPDTLRQAYQGSTQPDAVAQNTQGQQMRSALAQAIAKANGITQGRIAPAAAALQADEPAGVLDFARNPYTGVTMQLVKHANGNREIQRRSPDETRVLAKVMGREGKWLIQLNNGAEIETADVQLTSRGFLAGVQGQPVSFTEESGVRRFNWPQGFHPAAIQRGDVARTGYLLLERDQPQKGTVGKLFSSIKGLGATLGTNRHEDFALIDLHSGRIFPINSNASGKEVTTLSNCQRKNALTNVCRDASSSEQLYNSMGKNMGHYAWIMHWFQAPTGTFLIALEDGVRNLTVTRLETGEKRVAFTRTLGIADFNAEQGEDGRIKLSAKMAFDIKRIDDLEAGFASLPAAPAVPAVAQN